MIGIEDIRKAIKRGIEGIERDNVSYDYVWISKGDLLILRRNGEGMTESVNEILDDVSYPNGTMIKFLSNRYRLVPVE